MMLTKKLVVLGLITGLALYATPTRSRASQSAEVVKITASKFRFTPDHITLIKGQPVTLQLTSTDRTHGFMIRALKTRLRHQARAGNRDDGDACDCWDV
jgi:cytochrome c oxidase subunit II